MFRNITIRTKILLFTALLTGSIVVFQALYFPERQIDELTEGLEQKARSLSTLVAYEATAGLELDDSSFVEAVFDGLASDSDYVYALIFDKQGKLFARGGADAEAVAALKGRKFVTGVQRLGDIIRVTVPVMNEGSAIGTLITGFSTSKIRERTAAVRVESLEAGALVFIVGLILALLFGTSLGTRLRALTILAEKAARGDIRSADIDHKSQDEVGVLGRATSDLFTYMRQMSSAAEAVAKGNLSVAPSPLSEHDILAKSFEEMSQYLRDMAKVSEQIAAGNLSVNVEPRSKNDAFGLALRDMVLSLQRTADIADSIAAGNLDVEIEALEGDAFSQALSRMVKNLREQNSRVSGSVNELSAASSEIVALAKQTESNATDEAAAVEETRTTMLALLNTSVEIQDSANSMVDIAERSFEASKLTAERIGTLNEHALSIASVSEVIQKIADRSDILALNAALEGTKAGEAGRGFVLVGEEMRRLAETIMEAVDKIKHMASEIRQASQAAVMATETSQRLTRETTETSRRITMITRQQMSSTEQVTTSMNEIKQFTQQALSGATQSRETSGNLVRVAEDLTLLLNHEAKSIADRSVRKK